MEKDFTSILGYCMPECRVIEQISSDGTGIVYRCERGGADCAVKIISVPASVREY